MLWVAQYLGCQSAASYHLPCGGTAHSSSCPDVWQFGSFLVRISSMLLDFGALAMVTVDFPDSSAWCYACSSAFWARRAALLYGLCLLRFKAAFCGWWWEGAWSGSKVLPVRSRGLASSSDLTALTSVFNAEGWWSKSRNGCFLWKLPPERDCKSISTWKTPQDTLELTRKRNRRWENTTQRWDSNQHKDGNNSVKMLLDTLDQRPYTETQKST